MTSDASVRRKVAQPYRSRFAVLACRLLCTPAERPHQRRTCFPSRMEQTVKCASLFLCEHTIAYTTQTGHLICSQRAGDREQFLFSNTRRLSIARSVSGVASELSVPRSGSRPSPPPCQSYTTRESVPLPLHSSLSL